jgi:mono/diheme cytochrome c family protein
MGSRALVVVGFLVAACGGGGDPAKTPAPAPAPVGGGDGDLTAFQVEHGIGPVTEVVALGAVDPKLVAQGSSLFEVKCTACHKIAERYVGPALDQVLTRRTPTYVMNMILNPNEMVERHPTAKQVLAEYMTLMANQGLTVEEARAVLEYLRTQQKTGSRPTQ